MNHLANQKSAAVSRSLLKALVAVSVAGLLSQGCFAGRRAYTEGVYADPNTIELLGDGFQENDLQLISKKMVESLSASRTFKELQGRPTIVIGKMKNSTSEHIDMQSLADKISVQVSKTERFALMDKGARQEIAEEYEYQNSGYVAPDQAKGPGQQTSADYLLTGEIASIIQEVGDQKSIYYKMTTKLHNLRTGVIDWTEEKEIRKKFEKRSVGW